MLAGASLIPVSLGMTSWFYLVAISLLDLVFLGYAIALVPQLQRRPGPRVFRYSILYLTLLFAALFIDRLICPDRCASTAACCSSPPSSPSQSSRSAPTSAFPTPA
jgi:heme O synthase-like polyprenyltransferase